MGWLSKIFKKKGMVIVAPPEDEKQSEILGEDKLETDPVAIHPNKNSQIFFDNRGMVFENKVYYDGSTPPPLSSPEPFKEIKPLDLMKVKFVAAANQSKRRDIVRGITLHHIMMGGFKKNVDFLTSKASGVSAHYILGRNAELVQTVSTSKKAWHAGTSRHLIDGEIRTNLNKCMIGIEIVNPGYIEKEDDGKFYYNCGGKITEWKGDEQPSPTTIVYSNRKALSGYSISYPEKQLNKLVALCKALVEKYPQITRDNIVTHYEIATPAGRKNDPFGLNIEEDVKDRIFK